VENYAHFPDFGKWFLSFLMLIGRLELFTVLILFSPTFYKK
jgi:trk system potassium uptake protein TrkH